jgi:hypothetical protein
MTKRSILRYILPAIICAVSLLLSGRLILGNSRYFYHEDDAHHFNRTIEMAQRYSPNPHYFNKPALHFYLRIPVVYAAVAYERFQGRMQSVKDIRTRDPYGLAGYAYTASHPRIVASTRAVSAIWSCLIVALTVVAASLLKQPVWSSTLAALLVLLSPEVLKNSPIIGVDTLMGLLCLATTTYALWAMQCYTRRKLLACALCAGLCCAAKYNAAPIAIVPVVLWWLLDRRLSGATIALCAPLLGFILGAPYSLLSFREFWQGVSYEAWHYSVAGHEGHSAERGVPQLLFYLRWLLSDGLGVGGVVAAIIGVSVVWSSDRKRALILWSFPLAYAALMILQKTNFTRNMLVVVPYCAVAAACGISYLKQLCTRTSLHWVLVVSFTGLCVVPLASTSYSSITSETHPHESRDQVAVWLHSELPPATDVAIAGNLQLPIHVFALPGVDAFNTQKQSIASLIQAGYSYFVVPSETSNVDAQLTQLDRSIPGNPWPQRVPRNPGISILRVTADGIASAAQRAPSDLELSAVGVRLHPRCTPHAGETYCWVGSRSTRLSIPPLPEAGIIEVMSPWPNQAITVHDEQGGLLASTKLIRAGEWEQLPIPPRKGASSQRSLMLTATRVHSPQSQGMSSDRRRLALAIR